MLLRRFKQQPFACYDATTTDPTGTLDIRRKYRAMVEMRWSGLRKLVREAIVSQNMLGTGSSSVLSLAATYIGQSIGLGGGTDAKIKSFQLWFDNTLKLQVLGQTGGWIEPMIVKTYDRGVDRAKVVVSSSVTPPQRSDVIAALQAMTFSELQGIVEAVSQQAVRAVSYGVLHNYKPIQIFRSIADAIQKVGVNRSRAMVDMMVVKTYGQATLDTFKAAGVKQVGLLPERQPKPKFVRKDGAIVLDFKIKKVIPDPEADVELVEVLTAGDDLVCDECEGISEDGPYDIDDAYDLIPAHPHCRCAFVPWGDLRFAAIERGL